VVRTEREHCCDDVAVTLSGDAHEYALALAALEQCRWDGSETALAATGGNLVKRIRRLLIPTEGRNAALTPFVSAGILMITLAVGLTAWQEKAPLGQTYVAQTYVAQTRAAQAEPLSKPVPDVSPSITWLEEDVVYIITDEERRAFQRLQSDDERDEFIQQFWLRRDPTPGTPENEFKDEHYRRIAYANLRFPTAAGKAGWKTDRGRIYIVYGPPDEIDDHSTADTKAAIPFLDWTYRYLDGVGSNVKIEFVDPAGTHDFKMTSDPNPPAK
jgi:GWxTD domain-containing protein